MGATDLNLRATMEKVRKKRHNRLLEETCRHSCYFTSCLKNPYVHSPYLREAKVKDVGIQLLHCSREPVFAEILAAELAVGRPQTHICTKQGCDNTRTGASAFCTLASQQTLE